jgi:hypothetical protein
MGLSSINGESEDENLGDKFDESDWTVYLAAGCALEHLARILRDNIV